MGLTENWLQLIISLSTLIGMVVAIYKFSRDPDEKAERRLGLMEQMCEIHRNGNKDKFSKIDKNLSLIKENHLKHIEASIEKIKGDIKVIKVLLKQKAD